MLSFLIKALPPNSRRRWYEDGSSSVVGRAFWNGAWRGDVVASEVIDEDGGLPPGEGALWHQPRHSLNSRCEYGQKNTSRNP